MKVCKVTCLVHVYSRKLLEYTILVDFFNNLHRFCFQNTSKFKYITI